MYKSICFGLLLALLGVSLSDAPAVAQDNYSPVGIQLQAKNMHLWHGYKVTNSALESVAVDYTTRNGRFTIGLWNGQSFDADYTEFDYYLSYDFGRGIGLSVWDINNFSDYPNANIFNYNRSTTSHFIEATLSYQATPSLGFKWGTIVLGRDTYTNPAGKIRNAFSNYAEADYRFFHHETINVHLFVGGAFSFVQKAHFYGSKPGIVNLGFKISNIFQVLEYDLPVAATAMWNPEQQYGAMQLSVNIF